ncbi:hypothetical protein P7C71_g3910, partial [Lecanoromycetidae sp. Uapishka_2]
MTTALSKRHQARNERALQDLIKTVPGNDRCADCGARNPGWASWSLGIFLCMRCASLHRKLGTHISKVKSLSMDSWSNDQVDSMKRNGNTNTNRTFNPQNTKPPIPLDVDEVDAVLERFIRQKYDRQVFSGGRASQAARNHTGSTGSSEDRPPPLPDKPLPPKPGRRFGFGLRSSSSTVNAQRSLPVSPPLSPGGVNGSGRPPSPIRINKQSRVFGASVGGGGGEMEAKLVQLRDMGFADEKRNASVLKGLGGNLEKTIESLVRLGEGSAPTSRSRTPNPARNVAVSQPLPQSTQSTGAVNGISFMSNGALSQTSTGSEPQSRPHPINPLQAPPVRNFTSPNPYQPTTQPSQSHNPFDMPDRQLANAPLDNAFASMQISQQPQQPLFPNATGGYPSQPQQLQEARYQTLTPPVPQVPQQYIQSNVYPPQNAAPHNSHNPFYSATQPALTNPYVSTIQPQNTQAQYIGYQQHPVPQPYANGYSTDSPQAYSPQTQQGFFQQQPFQQQPQVQQPAQPQPQPQSQQQPQPQQYPNPYPPQHSITDPMQYALQNHQQQGQFQPQPQQQQSFNQFQPQPLQPQQTGRVDKSSILALYNYPQLAPPRMPNDSVPTSPVEQPTYNPPQRSVTMPVQLSTGSRNPFQAPTPSAAMNGSKPGLEMYRHASQESVDVGGYQNGRHSPDAFASLSARSVR